MRHLIMVSLMAALSACDVASSPNSQAPSVVDVRALILANDPMACAAEEAIRTSISAGDSEYGEALDKGMPAIRTDTISATDINPTIHEISCSATIHAKIAGAGGELSHDLIYKLRPALDNSGGYIASVFDRDGVSSMVSSQIIWWHSQLNPKPSSELSSDTNISSAPADAVGGENDNAADNDAEKDICRAKILRDVASIEDPSSVLKAGSDYDAVTQFWKNKSTGETRYCAHGSYCYPARVNVNGESLEAISLVNCAVGRQIEDDGTDILYSVE